MKEGPIGKAERKPQAGYCELCGRKMRSPMFAGANKRLTVCAACMTDALGKQIRQRRQREQLNGRYLADLAGSVDHYGEMYHKA